MKVLIISANTPLAGSVPASPSGPAYVAGAVLGAGHTVEVFDTMVANDLLGELETQIVRFDPDVIGISIKIVCGYIADESAELGRRRLDLRPMVKEVVDCVKQFSSAHIVLGGPGFNYYGRNWLEYLDLDYGIRGEADLSFPFYLKALEHGGNIFKAPGCIYRKNGDIYKVPRKLIDDLDATAFPAYELFALDRLYAERVFPAIVTKRGCAFGCTFCPHSSLEGKLYRLKSPGRVVDELVHIQKAGRPETIMFCDNSFNVPRKHAEAICKEIIARKFDVRWGTGALKPLGITDDLCNLFKDSGCSFVNLAVETASEKMLKQMKRGYSIDDIREALSCFSRSDIPFRFGLLIGAPGETPETITETFDLIESFEIQKGSWVSIGISLWTHHQDVLEDAREAGQLRDDAELFGCANYISPELPRSYMMELIESLRESGKYTVQINKPYAEYEEAPN